MTHNSDPESPLDDLRRRAEERLTIAPDEGQVQPPPHVDNLVHELRTHQIELELQNEELRHTQQELIESRNRYAHLYDYAPVGYVTVDHHGIIVEANLALADMLRTQCDALLHQPLTAFIAHVDQDAYYHHRRVALKSGQRSTARLRMQRHDEKVFSAQLDTILIPADHPDHIRLRTVVSDITLLAEAETRGKVARERLARVERLESLGILAGGVAHDLNNMLGPLVGLPDLIREDVQQLTMTGDDSTDDIVESLDILKQSAQRAADVVRELVHLGRGGDYQRVPMDLNGLPSLNTDHPSLREASSTRADVTFRRELSPEPLMVLGNADYLERAIGNLLNNAIEAINADGEVVTRTAHLRLDVARDAYELIPPGDYAVLSIRDNGEGIAPEHRARIFEPFFTRRKMSDRAGSGLGLSVVNGIVKDHQGFIDVASEVGRGTKFDIYLPLIDAAHPAQEETRVTPHKGDSERILVVDDEPSQRYLGRRSLRRLGYEVTEASDGHEALAHFTQARVAGEESPFDLVLLDMIMQEEYDGLQTYQAILELYPHQKVVIASGHAENERADEAKRLGAAWVAKPYELHDLATIVATKLNQP